MHVDFIASLHCGHSTEAKGGTSLGSPRPLNELYMRIVFFARALWCNIHHGRRCHVVMTSSWEHIGRQYSTSIRIRATSVAIVRIPPPSTLLGHYSFNQFCLGKFCQFMKCIWVSALCRSACSEMAIARNAVSNHWSGWKASDSSPDTDGKKPPETYHSVPRTICYQVTVNSNKGTASFKMH